MNMIHPSRRTLLRSLAAAPLALSGLVPVAAQGAVGLVRPEQGVDPWRSFGDRKNVRWSQTRRDGEDALEIGSSGAVALMSREIEADLGVTPVVQWRWQVEEIPDGANLNSLESDDIAAGLALVFGKAGVFRKVPPMLIYTWASDAHAKDEIIHCGRHAEAMRFVIARSGADETGRWLDEKRNVLDDYRAAFGQEPDKPLTSVALWSDRHQTGSSSLAWFAGASLLSA